MSLFATSFTEEEEGKLMNRQVKMGIVPKALTLAMVILIVNPGLLQLLQREAIQAVSGSNKLTTNSANIAEHNKRLAQITLCKTSKLGAFR